jgi:uncharacterized protein (DUF2336 family)
MESELSTMTAELSFMKDIENAIAGASTSRRGEMARKVADLFVSRSDEFSADDLSVFDDVIVRLTAEIEEHARALLSRRLAPIRNAPPRIIRLLALDDDIEVAGPVLAQSAQLTDHMLIEIAKTKGQAHMLAIAQRGSLSEAVTDVLVELGDREVVLNAVDNYGANFSDHGFTVLVSRSEGDDLLAEMVGSRPEIPSPLLTALVAKASLAVRAKLEVSHPRAKAAVHRAVAEAAGRIEAQVASTSLDYTAAMKAVESLRQSGQLNESALASFAKTGAYPETIATLATMCNLPLQYVEQAMGRDRSEALMVIAKAVNLSWATAQEILLLRAEKGVILRSEIVQRLARFERLQSTTAQEIVRVLRSRTQAKTAPAR